MSAHGRGWPAALVLALAACTAGGGDNPGPDESLPPIATEACPEASSLLPADTTAARKLPDLTLDCLGSPGSVRLRRLGGGRPVLLNLWASWCEPCRKEMPALRDLHLEFKDRLLVLGVDTRDFERPARATIQATAINYASVKDPDEKLRKGLDAIGPPVTVLLDATGAIRYQHVGELTEQEIRDALKANLGIGA
jgi:cytochrome c biogenesis protein CcmG, thiol:disulfide interchange protein DsbE